MEEEKKDYGALIVSYKRASFILKIISLVVVTFIACFSLHHGKEILAVACAGFLILDSYCGGQIKLHRRLSENSEVTEAQLRNSAFDTARFFSAPIILWYAFLLIPCFCILQFA